MKNQLTELMDRLTENAEKSVGDAMDKMVKTYPDNNDPINIRSAYGLAVMDYHKQAGVLQAFQRVKRLVEGLEELKCTKVD